MRRLLAPVGVTDEFQLDGVADLADPALAALRDGGYAMVSSATLRRKGPDPLAPLVPVFDADGDARRDPIILDIEATRYDHISPVQIAALPNGCFVVAVQHSGSDRWQAQAFRADGRPDGDPFELFPSMETDHVSIASTSEGFAAATLAFGQDNDGAWGQHAYLRSLDDARPMGQARRISDGDYAFDLDVHEERWGKVGVRWQEEVSDVHAYVAHYSADGDRIGRAKDVTGARDRSLETNGSVLVPIADDRTLLIDSDAFDGGIFTTTLFVKGEVEAEPTRIGEVRLHLGSSLQTTVLPDQSFMVA